MAAMVAGQDFKNDIALAQTANTNHQGFVTPFHRPRS
jgi:hypothetical protein